jgi:hypothetical protein
MPRTADTSRHADKGVDLRPLACWDSCFECRLEYGCLFLVSVLCIQIVVCVFSWLLAKRGHTECGVSERDRESSTIKRPWPIRGSCAMGENIKRVQVTCDSAPLWRDQTRSYCILLLLSPCVVSGSLSPWHDASSGCGRKNGLQYGGRLRIYWISSSGKPTSRGPPAWSLGEVLTTPHR